MFRIIGGLLKYRDLLLMLTFRDIRIRYKQAVMGFVWAIFMPIVAVFAGLLIRKAMAVVSGNSVSKIEIMAIAVKILPWTFLVSSIRFSVQSLVGNRDLITKIYFPRAVLPLASILACFFDFMIAGTILTIFLTFMKLGVSIYFLWMPYLLCLLILLAVGLGLFLSSANLFLRDVKYVVEIILMFGIFFTPVFYSASSFGNWQHLLLLNPMGSILESLCTAVVFKQMPDLQWIAYATASSIAIFILGVTMFHAKEPYFSENI